MKAAQKIIEKTQDPTHWQCPGWAVFNAEGSMQNEDGTRPLQIQAWTEMEAFDGDAEAHRFVVRAAEAGDPAARLALRYVRRYSRPEYDDVMEAAA